MELTKIREKLHLGIALTVRWIVVLFLSIVAGLESALILKYSKAYIMSLDLGALNQGEPAHVLLTTSLLSGISIVILISLVLSLPTFWRRVTGVTAQRALIYATIQVFGIALGLIGLNKGFSFWLTFLIVFTGTRVWWSWERRWRGVGRSPSIRSGILRPKIHPGQIWFAYVLGEKVTKNRPVMALKQSSSGRWIVAYYTTQPPKYKAQEQYFVEAKVENIRGMEKDSWINISDTKALKRSHFRIYVGLAPKALYERVCLACNVEPDPASWTIDEEFAGASYGPIEAEFRRAIGMDHGVTDPRRSVEDLRDIIKGFLKSKM